MPFDFSDFHVVFGLGFWCGFNAALIFAGAYFRWLRSDDR